MTKNFALLHCHSSESMPEVAPETVQLVITSPLYFPPDTEPFLYGEKDCGMSPGVAFDRVQAFASETLRSVMDECVRVLAPGGHLVLETRDVRIGHCLVPVEAIHRSVAETRGLELLSRHFWRAKAEKPVRLGNQISITRRFGPVPVNPEVFLVFTKPGADPRRGDPEPEDTALLTSDFMRTPAGMMPSRHRFQAPLRVLAAFIRTYTSPGDTVLDPFAGGGSAAYVANHLGRNAILYEIDPGSAAMIRKNVPSLEES